MGRKAQAKPTSSSNVFFALVLGGGAILAAFVGGFRLGQKMPDVEVVPGFATLVTSNHREAIEAPEVEIPSTVVSPDEFTFYQRPAPQPEAPSAAEEVVDPPVAALPEPDGDGTDDPGDGAAAPATRVLDRQVRPGVGASQDAAGAHAEPHEIERVAVVAAPEAGF